jgi:plasmid stabilization system protein ParE
MKRRFAVAWASIAEQDLAAILDFVARGSPAGASRLLLRLEQRASSLEMLPLRGRIVPELLKIQVREYRELLIGPYRLVYRVERPRVVVLGVFDGRRNLEDILLDRLIGT